MFFISAIRRLISGGNTNHEITIPSSEEKDRSIGLFSKEAVQGDLDSQGLSTCSKVSKIKEGLPDSEALRKKIIEDEEINLSNKSVKEEIKDLCPTSGNISCKSHDEVLQELKQFFQNIPEGKKGMFIVGFLPDNGKITLKLGFTDPLINDMELNDREPDYVRTCSLTHEKIDTEEILPRYVGGSSSTQRTIYDNKAIKIFTSFTYDVSGDLKEKASKYINEFVGICSSKEKNL